MEENITTETVKRNYKDRLFRRIFNEKGRLLSLYNAVNGTAYANPEELQINTLDNAIYMNIKNDISFIVGFYLNLYEHQSTYNPNMPLRDLFYIARLLEKEVGNKSFYTSALLRIPTPKFVVFYNGTEEQPERKILKLSDSFEKRVIDPELELKVTMLNINADKNQELMKQCRELKEYALYVGKVRRYAAVMRISEAVEVAVNESIEEGILKEFLTRYRAEAIQLSIFEYDEEKEIKLMRKAEYELGVAEGRQEKIISLVRSNLHKGRTASEIADFLELENTLAERIIQLVESHPQLTDTELAGRLDKT